MKNILIALVALLPSLVGAAGSNVHLEKANIDLHDKASLQRGFDYFQQYCAGCHSTQYQRYNRVAEDLAIPITDMKDTYLAPTSKIGDLMENAMPKKDAARWFGAAPPDLTLVARVRGEDWIYTYLKGFYKEQGRPFGVNNTVFPLVGMPHVLESLQGQVVKKSDGTLVTTGGTKTAEQYSQVVKDITGFLVYSADPIKLERERIGYWVLGFLFIFFILAYFLKKEYWKDVH